MSWGVGYVRIWLGCRLGLSTRKEVFFPNEKNDRSLYCSYIVRCRILYYRCACNPHRCKNRVVSRGVHLRLQVCFVCIAAMPQNDAMLRLLL